MKKTLTLTDGQVTAVQTALNYALGAVKRFPALPCKGRTAQKGYAEDIRAMEEAIKVIDTTPWNTDISEGKNLMTQKDKDRLLSNWKQETNDPETQEWREELTEEEQCYVDTLDDQYTGGIAAMCSAILVREQVRARFSLEEIKELETVYDHCILHTRSGRQYVVRLGRDGQIVLEEAV